MTTKNSQNLCNCLYESDCHGIEMIKSPSGKEWAIGGTKTQDRWNFCPWCGGSTSKFYQPANGERGSMNNTSKTGLPCKCCGGTGVQVRMTDGITVLCPCCGGSGNDSTQVTF